MTEPRLAKLDPSMSTAVLYNGNLIGTASHYNDRALAKRRRLVVPDIGDFSFKRTVKPMRPIPDAF
jgi:hypothetical protein